MFGVNVPFFLIYIFGILLFIYGMFKLLLGILVLTLNPTTTEYIKKYKILKMFVRLDQSIAGKLLSISVIIFSIYSIFHGLFMAKVVTHSKFINHFYHDRITYIMYGVLGVFMTLVYGYIVYFKSDDSIISKDKNANYKLTGLATGLFFLISLIIFYILKNINTLSRSNIYIAVYILAVILTSFIMIIIDEIEILKNSLSDVLHFVMIVLAMI